MKTRNRTPKTAREDWAETRSTRKGRPSTRAKRADTEARAFREYARSIY